MPSVPTVISGNLHHLAFLEDFQFTLVCVAPGRRVGLDQAFSRFLKEPWPDGADEVFLFKKKKGGGDGNHRATHDVNTIHERLLPGILW